MNIIGVITRVVLLTVVSLGVPSVSAETPNARSPLDGRAVLRAGQAVQGDYFAVGPHVEISGIVNEDL